MPPPSRLDSVLATERFRDATLVIFKHSQACDLSEERLAVARGALKDTSVLLLVVSVQLQGALSATIEELFSIEHASPQAIAIRRGRVVDVRSHWGITTAWLEDITQRLTAPDTPESSSSTT